MIYFSKGAYHAIKKLHTEKNEEFHKLNWHVEQTKHNASYYYHIFMYFDQLIWPRSNKIYIVNLFEIFFSRNR